MVSKHVFLYLCLPDYSFGNECPVKLAIRVVVLLQLNSACDA